MELRNRPVWTPETALETVTTQKSSGVVRIDTARHVIKATLTSVLINNDEELSDEVADKYPDDAVLLSMHAVATYLDGSVIKNETATRAKNSNVVFFRMDAVGVDLEIESVQVRTHNGVVWYDRVVSGTLLEPLYSSNAFSDGVRFNLCKDMRNILRISAVSEFIPVMKENGLQFKLRNGRGEPLFELQDPIIHALFTQPASKKSHKEGRPSGLNKKPFGMTTPVEVQEEKAPEIMENPVESQVETLV